MYPGKRIETPNDLLFVGVYLKITSVIVLDGALPPQLAAQKSTPANKPVKSQQ
jgi:hypothetical protein